MSIQIRPAVPADAPALLAIYAPYVAQTAITFEYDVPTETEFACRIADTLKKYPYLVAEQDGVPVGYAYAGKFHDRAAYDWSVETSIYVEQHQKRRGIGRLLHDALEQELRRRHFLNMNACIACPMGESDPYPEAAEYRQCQCLHCLPQPRQHFFPRKAGLPDGGRIPSVRL